MLLYYLENTETDDEVTKNKDGSLKSANFKIYFFKILM